MSKDLAPEVLAELSGTHLTPWYLVTVQLDQVYHLTTGPRITVGGITYEPGMLSGLQDDADRFVFHVFNEDWKHTDAVVNLTYRFNAASISRAPAAELLYADQDGNQYVDQADVHYIAQEGVPGIHLMSGQITTVSLTNPNQLWLVLTIDRSVGMFPRARIAPPLANFTRPDGTLIPVNQSIYRNTTRAGRA